MLIIILTICYTFSYGDYGIEELYADAVELYNNSKYEESTKKLIKIIESGIDDIYVYKMLLENCINLINTGNQKALDNLENLDFYLDKAALIYQDDELFNRSYGDYLRLSGRYDDFISHINRMYERNKNSFYANFYMGALYFLDQKFDRARKYLNNAVSNYRSENNSDIYALLNAYIYLGLIDGMDKKYKTAANYFEKALSLNPYNQEVLKYLALTYTEMVETNKALQILDALNELSIPELVNAYFGLKLYNNMDKIDFKKKFQDTPFSRAVMQYYNKKYNESYNSIINIIRVDSNQNFYVYYLKYLLEKKLNKNDEIPKTAFILGIYLRNLGYINESLKYLNEVDRLIENDNNLKWLIGSLYFEFEDYDKAEDILNKYLKNAKNDDKYIFSALYTLSLISFNKKNYTNAYNLIEKAGNIAYSKDEKKQYYYTKGMIYQAQSNYINAYNSFSNYYEIDKKNEEGILALCYAAFNLKKYNLIINHLENFYTNVNKNSKKVNNMLAYAYSIISSNLDRAEELVLMALKEDEYNPAYLDTLGWIYYNKKDYNKSLEVFKKVISILENYDSNLEGLDEIYYHIGAVYFALNDFENAKNYLKKSLEINPSFEEPKNILKTILSK